MTALIQTTPIPHLHKTHLGDFNVRAMEQRAQEALNITDPIEEICATCLEKVCEISESNRARLFSVLQEGTDQISDIVQLACGHYFHVSCHGDWDDSQVARFKLPTCPSCKADVHPESVEFIPGKIFNATKHLLGLMKTLENAPQPETKIAELETDIRQQITMGAPVDLQDVHKKTLLHYAVQGDHHALVSFLIEQGAPVHIRDKENKNPLHVAQGNDCQECIKALARARLRLPERPLIRQNTARSYDPFKDGFRFPRDIDEGISVVSYFLLLLLITPIMLLIGGLFEGLRALKNLIVFLFYPSEEVRSI